MTTAYDRLCAVVMNKTSAAGTDLIDILAERDELLAAIKLVRRLIGDGAMTGFNCHDGDWAERLFASQATTYKVVTKAEGRTP